MRIFFALWPDADSRRELAGWARRLQAVCGGTTIRSENLHLTLAFIGDVDIEQVAALRAAAARVQARRFTLRLDQAGCWKHKRIIWAGADVVSVALSELVADLRDSLAAAQLPFDGQAFVPHVTLLREASAPVNWPELTPITWTVGSYALVKSTSAERGVRYVVEALARLD